MKQAILAFALLGAAVTASAQNMSSDELNRRTVQRRAVEAALWGMPAVNYDLMLRLFRGCVGRKRLAPFADADNLAWKLALVLAGEAPESLLDSYCSERRAAARENILASTRSTEFITPKFPASRIFRDATLSLAPDFPFARALINSGRLSVLTSHAGSPLDTPDGNMDWVRGPAPGRAMVDAPLEERWLVDRLGTGFTLLLFGGPAPAPPGVTVVRIEEEGLARQRYDSRPGTAYLIRPDRYVAARWRTVNEMAVTAALRRACGHRGG